MKPDAITELVHRERLVQDVTLARYSQTAIRAAKWLKKNRRVEVLDASLDDIKALQRAWLKKHGGNPRVIRTYMAAVIFFYRRAVDAELIERSPADGLRRPKTRAYELRPYPSEDEIKRTVKSLDLDNFEQCRTAASIMLGVCSGARCGEMAAMRPSGMHKERDSEGRRKHLIRTEAKGFAHDPERKERDVVVGKDALPFLKRWMQHRSTVTRDFNDPLFVTRQGPSIQTQRLSACIRDAFIAAGFSGYPAHSLRVSYTVRMLEAGVSLDEVKRLLGHADTSNAIARYANHQVDWLQEEYDKAFG